MIEVFVLQQGRCILKHKYVYLPDVAAGEYIRVLAGHGTNRAVVAHGVTLFRLILRRTAVVRIIEPTWLRLSGSCI